MIFFGKINHDELTSDTTKSASIDGGTTSQQQPPQPLTDPLCPGSDNLNYTTTRAGSSSSSAAPVRTFRIQCGANYPGGDRFVFYKATGMKLVDCLDACAADGACVGVAFNTGTARDAPTCFLKASLGLVDRSAASANFQSGVLWQ